MMKLRNLQKTKKGAASLYAVIFATILFGVIALSFVRIILSEARQSGDDELSQSAYDSALAGVEDAKRAVNAYYKCLNSGGSAASCEHLYPFDESCEAFTNTDSKLKKALGYEGAAGEIKIQESSTAKGSDDETTTDQAYTCITMSKKVEDYRATLTKDTRVRVIPLSTDESTSDTNSVRTVKFEWFSENNGTTFERPYENQALKTKTESSNIPVISLTLLSTSTNINYAVEGFNSSTNKNYSTMILLPSNAATATNTLTYDNIDNAGDSNVKNTPFLIKCGEGNFACSVDLNVYNSSTGFNKVGSGRNALLIVSMPYGEAISDFVVSMYNESGQKINFEGAQISVDSTGRANQLYRRVETRLDPVDSYFPYPQFAAELDGSGEQQLLKNFWITYNCWTEGGTCPNNGSLSD